MLGPRRTGGWHPDAKRRDDAPHGEILGALEHRIQGLDPGHEGAHRAVRPELLHNVREGTQLGVAADVPGMPRGDPRMELAVPDVQIVRNAVRAGFQNLVRLGRVAGAVT